MSRNTCFRWNNSTFQKKQSSLCQCQGQKPTKPLTLGKFTFLTFIVVTDNLVMHKLKTSMSHNLPKALQNKSNDENATCMISENDTQLGRMIVQTRDAARFEMERVVTGLTCCCPSLSLLIVVQIFHSPSGGNGNSTYCQLSLCPLSHNKSNINPFPPPTNKE